MENLVKALGVLAICLILSYTFIGTDSNVKEIRKRVPEEITSRNWEILRYEGFEYGSWNKHGGYVWYHVRNTNNHNIQYRVNVSLWDSELQWYYGEPEKLNRLELNTEHLIAD